MISRSKSLRRYCSEDISRIENYDKAVNDKEHMWECHHRAEILPCGRYSQEELKKVGMFWHRPASELIFLRHDEHKSLHATGHIVGNTTRRRISRALANHPISDETKTRISQSLTNHPNTSAQVEMTRLSDGFTKVFPSQHEAERWLWENGYPEATYTSISRCVNGILSKAYESTWRRV